MNETTQIYLTKIAENEQKVYDAGKDAGKDEFWDKYLNYEKDSGLNGASYLFGGSSWNDETFYPKKDIRLIGGNMRVFAANGCTNIRERLLECGVKIGGSNRTNLTGVQAFFMSARTVELPDFENTAFSSCDQFCSGCTNLKWFPDYDFSRCTNFSNIFLNCGQLEQIVALDVGSATNMSGAFSECTSLTEIRLRGTLGVSIDFKYSPLSVKSMKSVISALKDFSESESGYAYTVTFKTSAFEALEAEGATAEYNGIACTWGELIDNKKWNLVKSE